VRELIGDIVGGGVYFDSTVPQNIQAAVSVLLNAHIDADTLACVYLENRMLLLQHADQEDLFEELGPIGQVAVAYEEKLQDRQLVAYIFYKSLFFADGIPEAIKTFIRSKKPFFLEQRRKRINIWWVADHTNYGPCFHWRSRRVDLQWGNSYYIPLPEELRTQSE